MTTATDRSYRPTESKFKGGAKEMYVTYDVSQTTRNGGHALYPKVKRVYIAGKVKDWTPRQGCENRLPAKPIALPPPGIHRSPRPCRIQNVCRSRRVRAIQFLKDRRSPHWRKKRAVPSGQTAAQVSRRASSSALADKLHTEKRRVVWTRRFILAQIVTSSRASTSARSVHLDRESLLERPAESAV